MAGRKVLSEHLYGHISNVHGPERAVDYLDTDACDWTPEEIDFVNWVLNASPALGGSMVPPNTTTMQTPASPAHAQNA